MMRLLLLAGLALFPMAAAAQSDLSKKALAQLDALADRIALVDPGEVPETLLLATLAFAELPGERPLAEQVAGLHLGAMEALERKASVLALAGYLDDRLSREAIARVYAATIFYGRNCYGYQDAVRGLARRTPSSAEDEVWLALAALPRSPSWYLTDRSALKARVALIVDAMETSNLVTKARADRLRDLPLASVDSGGGCSGR